MIKIVTLLLSFFISTKCELEPFIVGGNFTNIESHPHSAFLTVTCVSSDGARNVWICGASIINQRLLLTAAHCVADCTASSNITINVGSEDNNKGFATTAHSFLVHENYVASRVQFDIALIKTRATLNFSDKVSRVVLLNHPPKVTTAQLAGWGLVNEFQNLMSPLLKTIEQKVWSRIDCVKILGPLPAGTLCAGSPSSNDYAAPGDSGSALLIQDYIQIGLVSYKVPFISRSLIVYTDVGYYYNWIEKHTKTLYCA
ncbi:hypothetical protein K1T71_002809 [Dendrolimus kikuchii]|uniref:Uncharacterized protein n=1 Tax=Dendrolimus kikuchii TaxID=765133 RepID=A0ACC1DDX6_9NEOP|nr:hypothetical protein K1T71_002809 [Dendrolimus kikuchii]